MPPRKHIATTPPGQWESSRCWGSLESTHLIYQSTEKWQRGPRYFKKREQNTDKADLLHQKSTPWTLDSKRQLNNHLTTNVSQIDPEERLELTSSPKVFSRGATNGTQRLLAETGPSPHKTPQDTASSVFNKGFTGNFKTSVTTILHKKTTEKVAGLKMHTNGNSFSFSDIGIKRNKHYVSHFIRLTDDKTGWHSDEIRPRNREGIKTQISHASAFIVFW